MKHVLGGKRSRIGGELGWFAMIRVKRGDIITVNTWDEENSRRRELELRELKELEDPNPTPSDIPSPAVLLVIAKSPELNRISNVPVFTSQIKHTDGFSAKNCCNTLHHRPAVLNALQAHKF